MLYSDRIIGTSSTRKDQIGNSGVVEITFDNHSYIPNSTVESNGNGLHEGKAQINSCCLPQNSIAEESHEETLCC